MHESSSAHRHIEYLKNNIDWSVIRVYNYTYTHTFFFHEGEFLWMVVMMRESEHVYINHIMVCIMMTTFTPLSMFTYRWGDWTANWNICSSEHWENRTMDNRQHAFCVLYLSHIDWAPIIKWSDKLKSKTNFLFLLDKNTITIDLIKIDNFHQMRMMCHQHFLCI
jgi:hypothetical protein